MKATFGAGLLLALLAAPPARGTTVPEILGAIRWGEPSRELLTQFGARAAVLRRPIDFGDSYAEIVLRDTAIGRVPLIAFFQMDKTTGGLKRVQLERQRHGVNPPAFRAMLGELEASYGAPDAACSIRPGPVGGYQAASELVWRRHGAVIRAIFRDTTIEAFEGCLSGNARAAGPCGLTGQLLVRISPPEADGAGCLAPPRPR